MPEALNERRFKELKREWEDAKAETERARGALSEMMVRLEKEFGCKTLKEAKTKLEGMQRKLIETEDKYNAALLDYEKRWKQ
jgi:hypothetical protein